MTTYDQLPRAAQIILAACAPEPKKEQYPFWDELTARCGKLDIAFTVNGCELDFSAFAKELENQFDRATEEAAKELLKGRTAAIQEKLRRVEDFIDAEFHELYKE